MTFRVRVLPNKYVNGLVKTFKDIDLDVFSYSELMELVKALVYTRIEGIYVRKGENSDGWEFLTNNVGLNEYTIASKASELDMFLDYDVDSDVQLLSQMQPHVILRTKRSRVKPKQDKSLKASVCDFKR